VPLVGGLVLRSLGRSGGRDRPKAACPPGCSAADGEAGGFNAVQKVLTRAAFTAFTQPSTRALRRVMRDSGRL